MLFGSLTELDGARVKKFGVEKRSSGDVDNHKNGEPCRLEEIFRRADQRLIAGGNYNPDTICNIDSGDYYDMLV